MKQFGIICKGCLLLMISIGLYNIASPCIVSAATTTKIDGQKILDDIIEKEDVDISESSIEEQETKIQLRGYIGLVSSTPEPPIPPEPPITLEPPTNPKPPTKLPYEPDTNKTLSKIGEVRTMDQTEGTHYIMLALSAILLLLLLWEERSGSEDSEGRSRSTRKFRFVPKKQES